MFLSMSKTEDRDSMTGGRLATLVPECEDLLEKERAGHDRGQHMCGEGMTPSAWRRVTAVRAESSEVPCPVTQALVRPAESPGFSLKVMENVSHRKYEQIAVLRSCPCVEKLY